MKIALLFFLSALVAVGSGSPLKLWYRQPARNWNEALPIGNGRIGAMVFGGVENERIQLNDDTLWDGQPSDRVNPKALAALPEVRRLIFEGKNAQATKLAEATMMGVPATVNSYQTLGDLHVRRLMVGENGDYRRELGLDTATAETVYFSGGTKYTQTVFASASDDVIVVQIESSLPGGVDLAIDLDRPENFTTKTDGNNGLIMTGRAGRVGVQYAAMVRVLTDEGRSVALGNGIRVYGANSATLILTSKTDYNSANPGEPLTRDRVAASKATLDRAVARGYDELLKRHLKEHRRLFRRVDLDLGTAPTLPTDERLERLRNTKYPSFSLQTEH